MKYRLGKKYYLAGITAFLVIAAGLLFYYFLFENSNITGFISNMITICKPIIYGLLFSYLLTPVVNFQEQVIFKKLFKKIKLDPMARGQKRLRTITIIITYSIVIALIYGFASLVIPQLQDSIQNIISLFPTYVTNLQTWASETLNNNPSIEAVVTKYLNEYSSEISSWVQNDLMPMINTLVKSITSNVVGIISGVMGIFVGVFNFIIGAIISIYVLSSKEKFCGQSKKIIYGIFNTEKANAIIKNFRFVNKTFNNYLSGIIFDSILIGFITFCALTIMKMPYPVLIAVIVGMTNIIPFFGPYLGGIPSAILILMVNPLQALYFIIFILVLQQIDGNIISPRILGSTTGLPAFWVICSITLFGGLFGILGMVVAVPTTAVILTGIHTQIKKKLREKELPEETKPYVTVEYVNEHEFVNIMPKEYKLNQKKYSLTEKIRKLIPSKIKNKQKDE